MTEPQIKVLLVDDDKFLLDMYCMKFAQAGYGVHSCMSVDDCLKQLRGGVSVDAVVFDIIMPEKDGFELLENMKREKLSPGATLIALTNQSDDLERKKAESYGASQYIVKASMIPSEVVSAVSDEIKRRKKLSTLTVA